VCWGLWKTRNDWVFSNVVAYKIPGFLWHWKILAKMEDGASGKGVAIA